MKERKFLCSWTIWLLHSTVDCFLEIKCFPSNRIWDLNQFLLTKFRGFGIHKQAKEMFLWLICKEIVMPCYMAQSCRIYMSSFSFVLWGYLILSLRMLFFPNEWISFTILKKRFNYYIDVILFEKIQISSYVLKFCK